MTPVPKWRTPRPLGSYSLSSHTPQEHAHTLAKAQHCKHSQLWTVNREPCVWSRQPGSCWDVSGVRALDDLQSLIHHRECSAKTHSERASLLSRSAPAACLLLTWRILLWECHILGDLWTNFESFKVLKRAKIAGTKSASSVCRQENGSCYPSTFLAFKWLIYHLSTYAMTYSRYTHNMTRLSIQVQSDWSEGVD